MKRKYGFTLVELLIVLAVIAALIATITPLALNAIRRARASQVAQNFRTLASALENAAYVNGAFATDESDTDPEWLAGEIKNAAGDGGISFAEIGRNINLNNYGLTYEAVLDANDVLTGTYNVWIYSNAEANFDEVEKIFPEIQGPTVAPVIAAAADNVFSLDGDGTDDLGRGDQFTFTYYYSFNVY
jgi:general secretion pathway protein G